MTTRADPGLVSILAQIRAAKAAPGVYKPNPNETIYADSTPAARRMLREGHTLKTTIYHAQNAQKKESTTQMAIQNKPGSNKPATQTAKPAQNGGAKPESASKGAPRLPTGPKPEKKKRAKVRLVSTTVPGLWVRAFVDVVEKHGYPQDPNGQKMVPGKAPQFGLSQQEREARKQAKEAEKARFDAMSDAEKLEYAAKQREERTAKKNAKKTDERNTLIRQVLTEMGLTPEQIDAKIAEGKLGALAG